jgi:hypothetical protein
VDACGAKFNEIIEEKMITIGPLSIGVPELLEFIGIISALAISISTLISQNKNALKLKFIESDLEKNKFEHQEQFQKLHEKRFNTVIEIFEQLVTIEILIIHVIQETEVADIAYKSLKHFKKEMNETFAQISLKLQDLAAYCNLNRMFLDSSIIEKLVKLSDFALDESNPLEKYSEYITVSNIKW